MKRNITAAVATLIFVLFCSSCAKIDTTELGGSLIPAIDNVNTFDTVLDVISDNRQFADTTRILLGQEHGVGIIENDAEFGKTSAAIYSSFSPASYSTHPFGADRSNVIIDSVVLSLAYANTFGDSNAVQQIEVREIDPASSFALVNPGYLLNAEDFPVLPSPIGSSTVQFVTLNDSVYYSNAGETIRSKDEMRIPLDTAWARRFVSYDTTTAYASDSVFKTQFKGLEIRANEASSPVKTALAYFDLGNNDRSRITFYCRVTTNGSIDTIAPVFTYTQDAHANIIRREPANGYKANIENGADNDELLYIQGAPGSYAHLQIPGLSLLDNRVIHRAELIAEKYPSQEDFYAAPPLMFLDAVNATGDSVFTIRNDFVVSNNSPGYDLNSLGGVFNRNQYVFNVSRYVQSIVTKKLRNYDLRIHAPYTVTPFYLSPNTDQVVPALSRTLLINAPVASGRVVLYGGANTDTTKRLRLRIIYSKI